MFVEIDPFPYLDISQYAGKDDGDIVFLDQSIPEEKKEWLRKEYRKWWNERQEKLFNMGIT